MNEVYNFITYIKENEKDAVFNLKVLGYLDDYQKSLKSNDKKDEV